MSPPAKRRQTGIFFSCMKKFALSSLVCFLMKIGSFFRYLFLVNFLYLEAVVCPHLRPLLCRHRRGLPQQQVTSGHSLFFVPDGLAAGAAEITRAHGVKTSNLAPVLPLPAATFGVLLSLSQKMKEKMICGVSSSTWSLLGV